jgi:DNA modification methylase
MTPFYTDSLATLYQGDVLDVLRQMPDNSVQCVVTSPPYYSLRDYGTGTWDGGDPECDHMARTVGMSDKNTLGPTGYLPPENAANVGRKQQYSDNCGKCGAIRIDQQIGLEATPEAFIEKLVTVFREVRRVLRDDGTLWLNIGDSYAGSGGAGGDYAPGGLKEGQPTFAGTARTFRPGAGRADGIVDERGQRNRNGVGPVPGIKPKDLIGIPWMLAFALRADGWYLRSDIIWHKPNPMPESVTDRPAKAHEYVFLLTKSARYFYDADAVRERTGNEMSWSEYNARLGNNNFGGELTTRYGIDKHDGGHSHPAGRNKRTVWTIPEEVPVTWQSAVGSCLRCDGLRIAGDVLGTLTAALIAAGYAICVCETNHAPTGEKRDVWQIATQSYPGSHFATFPEKLVEPCILAGTSERGACPHCGAPWRRVVEKKGGLLGKGWTDHTADLTKGSSQVFRADGGTEPYTVTTVGWQQSCTCPAAEPVPCVVLEPFAGSGTTLMVAKRLVRRSIGIDLSADYLALAVERIKSAEPGIQLDMMSTWELTPTGAGDGRPGY